ncbi:type II toxin-antitoxin system antitoxin SocA domain-containing protein [Clostridium sporogenes]|uniref:Panacea domain-containing protein n=1 Tax=Clostridium sporogenes TaxID=1509 RepID=UPI00313C5DDC
MNKVMDVAQYIINYSIEKDKPISNLKLQKILYYIQAAFLTNRKKPCFNEKIQNWRHGPVVPEVYREYKIYSNGNINDRQTGYSEFELDENLNLKINRKKYEENDMCEIDKNLINKVVDSYLDVEAWEMVKRTHEEDPWKYSCQDEEITLENIQKYFEKNKERIYGGN